MVLAIGARFDPSCDQIVSALADRRVKVMRVHPEEFPSSAQLTFAIEGGRVTGRLLLHDSGREVDLARVYSVYFSHPKPPNPTFASAPEVLEFAKRETDAALRGLWRVLDDDALWVSAPHAIRAAESKPFQLRLAADLGLATPRTLVTMQSARARSFLAACRGRMVFKALAQSGEPWLHDGDGTPLLQLTNVLDEQHLELLDRVQLAPCLFQEYVEKKVELRVTVVGDKVFAAELDSQSDSATVVDWRRMDHARPIPHQPHQLPPLVEDACRRMVSLLRLRYGAIDLILTPEDEYVFLEINPVGQWGWIEQLTGMPICAALCDLLHPSDRSTVG